MAGKQDVGIKISKPGYSTTNAPDYGLIFSSSWSQFPIMSEYTSAVISPIYDGTYYMFPTVTFNHNVGYKPFCSVWVKGQTVTSPTAGIKHTSAQKNIQITGTSVSYTPQPYTSTVNPGATQVHFKVYGINLEKNTSYPFKQPPTIQQPYDKDYGIKLTKEGKSISSNDMRNFIIHSRCQSPQVDSVIINYTTDPVSNSTSVDYLNSSGYTNWVFGFASMGTAPNNYFTFPSTHTSQQPPLMRIDKTSAGIATPNAYSVSNFAGNAAVLLVLRDPLFVAEEVSVVY